VEKGAQKFGLHNSVMLKKLPKVNNHPLGEKSSNLVTLISNDKSNSETFQHFYVDFLQRFASVFCCIHYLFQEAGLTTLMPAFILK
jgi:hypothetical protein